MGQDTMLIARLEYGKISLILRLPTGCAVCGWHSKSSRSIQIWISMRLTWPGDCRLQFTAFWHSWLHFGCFCSRYQCHSLYLTDEHLQLLLVSNSQMTVKVGEDSKYLNFRCSFHWIVLLLKDFFIPRVNHLKKEKERGGGKEEEEMKQFPTLLFSFCSWALKNLSLNCTDPLIHRFFCVCTVL